MPSARTRSGPGVSPNGPRQVDGVSVSEVVTVEKFDDVTDVIRAASASNQVVVPWGGGTHMGLGNVPTRLDLALNLTRLNQVVVYEPDDLTISVQAGCRIGDLHRLLGEHGQMLPFDVARSDDATVGGLYASAISGPRRFGYGAMRDLVIGITSVSPTGEISRGGGMVVKNVSGYDMMRLHYGALGSLGVVLQLNFKVLPAPRSTMTVVGRFEGLQQAFDAAMAVRESPLGPSAIVLLNQSAAIEAGFPAAPWTILLRAEGPEQSVPRQAERLVAALSPDAGEVSMLEGEQSAVAWPAVNRALSSEPVDEGLRLRLGEAPSKALGVIGAVQRLADERSLSLSLTADLGTGLVYAAIGGAESAANALSTIWEGAQSAATHATILAAPPEVKVGADVFGKLPAGFPVMQALKQQFDPSGILNRGRFVGHL